MKKSVLAVLVASVLSASAFANDQFSRVAIDPVGTHRAAFDTLNVDPNLGMLVNAGNVVVDYDAKEVTLSLYRYIECVKAPCPIGMPAPYIVTLPITKISYDRGCHARVITAQQDLRPVDGSLQYLEIVDNSTNICKSMHIVPGVEALYQTAIVDRFTGEEVITTSTFSSMKRLARVWME